MIKKEKILIFDGFAKHLTEYFDFGLVGSAVREDVYNDLDIIATLKTQFSDQVDELFSLAGATIRQFQSQYPFILNTSRAPQNFKLKDERRVIHLFIEPDASWPYASPGCKLVWARTLRPLFRSSFTGKDVVLDRVVNWTTELSRYRDVVLRRKMMCWVFDLNGNYVKKEVLFNDEYGFQKLLKFSLVLSGIAFWYSLEPNCSVSSVQEIANKGLPILGEAEKHFVNLLMSDNSSLLSEDFSLRVLEATIGSCKDIYSFL